MRTPRLLLVTAACLAAVGPAAAQAPAALSGQVTSAEGALEGPARC